MKSIFSAITVALLSIEVSAFTGILPPGYKPAKKHDHFGNVIADMMGMDKSFKYSLHKRALSKRSIPVDRRMNDFQVDISNNPSLPQSAPLNQDTTDYSYFCDVVLGTSPGLHVWLLMDTGSSVLWVMGEECQTQACLEHDQFGASDSKTYKTGAGDFFIQYATGNVSGDVITDQVSLAGIDLSMDFGVAKTTTDEFVNYPIDGILGLARTPGPGPTMPTFLQILQQNKVLKQNIFGMNLARASDGSNDGEINFGSIDTTKFKGDLNWQNTVGDLSRWTIPIDGIMVDGKFTDLTSDRTAIIDTGTSYLYMPPDDAKPIFDAIPGDTLLINGSYVIPCDTDATVSLVFNGVAYDLPVKDYVGQKLGSGCVSHIFPLDVVGDGKSWLVGDTFLKNVYTVFDSDSSRIGFGAKGSTTTISSLVTTPTPTVSAGSNQIMSGVPTKSAVSGSSTSNPSGATGVSSSSTASASGGMLPIGPGGASAQTGTASSAADTSSGSNTPGSSDTTNTNTRTGAASLAMPMTVAQISAACLFLVGVLML